MCNVVEAAVFDEQSVIPHLRDLWPCVFSGKAYVPEFYYDTFSALWQNQPQVYGFKLQWTQMEPNAVDRILAYRLGLRQVRTRLLSAVMLGNPGSKSWGDEFHTTSWVKLSFILFVKKTRHEKKREREKKLSFVLFLQREREGGERETETER